MTTAAEQTVSDLYTSSEQDNIKAEIEEAQIYMQHKRKEEAEELKKQRIKEAREAMENQEKAQK